MKPFSERYGYKQPKVDIQTDSMDDDLRNALWNEVYAEFTGVLYTHYEHLAMSSSDKSLYTELWKSFFKFLLDEMPRDSTNYLVSLKKLFYRLEWHEVYDLIEFMLDWIAKDSRCKFYLRAFKDKLNNVLESNLSGYRIIKNCVALITEDAEIEEIESAIHLADPLDGVKKHLQTSLEFFSRKHDHDYRNSIKESISAVESLCKIICGNPKATLGEALESIEKRGLVTFHKALKSGLLSLYGYTSDEQGIRHAFTDGKSEVFQEDARFMLVSCSAFVNYFIVKADKAGIDLRKDPLPSS